MKTYYLFATVAPVASDKPVFKCQARDTEHATEKTLALYGPIPDGYCLISAEQWRDENALVLEQMKLTRQEMRLPAAQRIWNL